MLATDPHYVPLEASGILQPSQWAWDVVAVLSSDAMKATVFACKLRQQGIAAETFIGNNVRKLQRKANKHEASVFLDEGTVRCNLYGGKRELGDNPIRTVIEVMYEGVRVES